MRQVRNRYGSVFSFIIYFSWGVRLNKHICTAGFFTVCALLVLFLIGCDRVDTISQSVDLELTDKLTARPASGVRVLVKIAWLPSNGSSESGMAKKQWEGFKWHEGTTDSSGIAHVVVVSSLYGWKPGSGFLRGREYLALLEQANCREEVVLNMSPGNRVDSQSYEILVKSLGDVIEVR